MTTCTPSAENDEDIARTLAMFGGFTEGVQLFASFAMLMNFPRFNKMKGMGQIVSWSVRDESLHVRASSSCSTPSRRSAAA
jgi:ribonucleoside-diphosphate reductase beta chain